MPEKQKRPLVSKDAILNGIRILSVPAAALVLLIAGARKDWKPSDIVVTPIPTPTPVATGIETVSTEVPIDVVATAEPTAMTSIMEVLSLELVQSDSELYMQAVAGGSSGVIGVDVESVADVLFMNLHQGEHSESSNFIAVYVRDGAGYVTVHPYYNYRIGSTPRYFVQVGDTVYIDSKIRVDRVETAK